MTIENESYLPLPLQWGGTFSPVIVHDLAAHVYQVINSGCITGGPHIQMEELLITFVIEHWNSRRPKNFKIE